MNNSAKADIFSYIFKEQTPTPFALHIAKGLSLCSQLFHETKPLALLVGRTTRSREIDNFLVYLLGTNTNSLCAALRQGTLALLSALLRNHKPLALLAGKTTRPR
jgi:hypothetical protein